MKNEQDVQPKRPTFMLTINFNGKQGITSFMSKDMTKDAVAYLLGLNIGEFLQQSTESKDAFMFAMDKFLIGLEMTAEKVLGSVFKENKKSATEKIVADLRKKAWQSKKIVKKTVTKKRK